MKLEKYLKKYNVSCAAEMLMLYIEEEKNRKIIQDEADWKEIKFLLYHSINAGEISEAVGIAPSEETYNSTKGTRKAKLPTEWFSKEEIEDFIAENLFAASSDYEKEVDAKLKRIWELLPETKAYFDMPKEWEENGLAD